MSMVIFRKVFKCILLKLRFHCISSVLISRKELFDIYGNGWGLGSRYRSWGIFHEICNSYYYSLLWCPRLFFFYSSMNLFCLLKVLVIIYYLRCSCLLTIFFQLISEPELIFSKFLSLLIKGKGLLP